MESLFYRSLRGCPLDILPTLPPGGEAPQQILIVRGQSSSPKDCPQQKAVVFWDPHQPSGHTFRSNTASLCRACSAVWPRGGWSSPQGESQPPIPRGGHGPTPGSPQSDGGDFAARELSNLERATEPPPSGASTPAWELWCLAPAACLKQRKIQVNPSCLVRQLPVGKGC